MINQAVISKDIDYYKELEAIAKFSQKKYEGLFVEFLGWYENDDSVFIVMEYMEHGDLDSHLKEPLPENEAREITLQVAEGLKQLHENGFAHRDLKPANIFVFRRSPEWWVKIGDFGISKRVNDSGGLQTWVRASVFLAPEVQMLYPPGIDDHGTVLNYTESRHMGAGRDIVYMIFHDYPFAPRKPIGLPQYIQGAELPFPTPPPPLAPITQGCYGFIKATMAPDASKRLSAKEATENEWLRGDIQTANLKRMQSLHTQGVQLFRKNKLEKAVPMLQQAAEERNLALGLKHHDTRNSYHCLGVLYYHLSEYSKAKPFFERVLEVQQKLFGPKDRSTLKSRYWIGVLTMREGSYQEGRAILQQVVGIQRKVFGLNDPDTLLSLSEIDQQQPQILEPPNSTPRPQVSISPQHLKIEKTMESKRQSIRNFTTALERSSPQPKRPLHVVCVQLPPNNSQLHPNYCTLAELGERLHGQGDYEAAQHHLEMAVNGFKETLGPTHASSLETLYWLGRNQYELSQYKTAEDIFREVTDGLAKSAQSNDLRKLHPFNALGLALSKQGKYEEAESVFRCALNGSSVSQDSRRGFSLFQLGLALYKQGKTEEAMPILRDAFHQYDKWQGPNNDDTIEFAYWLGRVHFDQKRYRRSEEAFRGELIARGTRTDTSTYLWLGLAMYFRGKCERSIPFLHQAFEKRNTSLGKYHLDTSVSAYFLGLACYNRKGYAEAEALLLQALDGWKMELPMSHSQILDCLEWYGDILEIQGKYQMAEAVWEEWVEANTLAFAYDHPSTLMATRRWAKSLECQGKTTEAHSLFDDVWGIRNRDLGADHHLTLQSAEDTKRTKPGLSKETS